MYDITYRQPGEEGTEGRGGQKRWREERKVVME